jgi:hypothetical protein
LFLDLPGYGHCPAFVAEITLDFTADGLVRVGGETPAPAHVKPANRLHQSYHPDLHQVIETFATGRVFMGDVIDKILVLLEDAVGEFLAGIVPVGREQLALFGLGQRSVRG